ncbi:MAG TPA: hypothetical protein VFW65_18595 [Pseudonocardiaceae bacterium]|nr:hypothetical protein [Pseudonocardiaceae bacterium]
MRKFLVRTLLIGGAAAAAVALVAGQSSAAGTTVTISGANASFTGVSTDTVLADVTSGQTFSCTKSTAGGSLANVTSAALPFTTKQNGGAAHSITSLSFTGCTSSFGSATVTVPAANLPDDLTINSVSTTAPQASGNVTTAGTSGDLANISVLTCSFRVTGSAPATWTDGPTNQLDFTGGAGLHPANISAGCFGLVGSTDVLSYTGHYTITPSTINVSTP